MKILQESKILKTNLIQDLEKFEQESLTDYAENLAEEHLQGSNAEQKKAKGQFFTSKEVARFMVGLFDIKGERIRFLDPGAGAGILTAAFCERILSLKVKVALNIDAYENDPLLIPSLNKVLQKCKSALKKKGHDVHINIIENDFILKNASFFDNEGLSLWHDKHPAFDYVISNPPYYKLNVDSVHAKTMKGFDLGHPNVYALFMTLSLRLLNPEGEMVFITPRSFCSGLYYKKFRAWLLKNAVFSHIHIFGSRKDVFEQEGVLQENIILKVAPRKPKRKNIESFVDITVSKNQSFEDIKLHRVAREEIFHEMNEDTLIKIPTSQLHIQIQHAVKDWRYTLYNLGLEVSTGPIVHFRVKELLKDFVDEKTTAPLIWMHNIKGMEVVWPEKKSGKETAVRLVEDSKALLLPIKNYVLIKRFSSKEQERRLYAGLFLSRNFNSTVIGIENHVNYLYRRHGDMTPNGAVGMTALLNTAIVDEYFRCLNGNTQVNASDLRVLPFPCFDSIEEIGKVVTAKKPEIGFQLDSIVAATLGISDQIVRSLHGKN